jgi:hypothetical protein
MIRKHRMDRYAHHAKPKKASRICMVCGDRFQAWGSSTCCSDACRKARNVNWYPCPACGKEFYGRKGWLCEAHSFRERELWLLGRREREHNRLVEIHAVGAVYLTLEAFSVGKVTAFAGQPVKLNPTALMTEALLSCKWISRTQ